MISKELFSEVMKYDGDFKQYYTEQIMNDEYPLSIHELANKCKEWAYTFNDLLVLSGHSVMYKTWECYIMSNINDYQEPVVAFEADSEPEAIFKACRWILDNRNI